MSGLADVYQRRLIGFTIESRNFIFRSVRGSKECRIAEENNCCIEESGESGESGSSGSESGGSVYEPNYIISKPSCCSDELLPEKFFLTRISTGITYEMTYIGSPYNKWFAFTTIDGISYRFLLDCGVASGHSTIPDSTIVWILAISDLTNEEFDKWIVYYLPDETCVPSNIDVTENEWSNLVDAPFAGEAFRISTFP